MLYRLSAYNNMRLNIRILHELRDVTCNTVEFIRTSRKNERRGIRGTVIARWTTGQQVA